MMITGCDISTWQDSPNIAGNIDFAKMASRASFVIIKATQATFTDSDFVKNWTGARDAQILRGAYHFFTWDKSPIEQADYFWSVIQDDPGELPPTFDYEYRTGAPKDNPGLARASAKEFLERLKMHARRQPMIYTSPYYWFEYGSADAYWLQYPLWIAHYTTASSPSVPKPWTNWKFWQYTAKGPGADYGVESAGIDLDRFNGSYDDLLTFCGGNPLTDAAKLEALWKAHPELWR